MSVQSELYNGCPTNLPLLSLEELQVLHDYNERMVKDEAQADLYLMTQEPALLFTKLSSNTTLDAVESTDTQWNFWNERDDEVARTLCEDQTDKTARWERLYEQGSIAQGAAETVPEVSGKQFINNSYLDPRLRDTGAAALRDHNKQILAMNALLHLQDQGGQSRQVAPPSDADTRDHTHTGQQKIHLERSISPDSQSLIDQNLLHTNNDSILPYAGGPVKRAKRFACGESSPINMSMRRSQSGILPDEILEDNGAFKVNRPSISFLPQASNGYDHSPIHFPSLSYVVEGITNNLEQNSDSMPEHDTSQSQNITSYTSFDSPFPTAITDNNLVIDPSELDLTHEQGQHPVQIPKNIKKGTQPKKPFVPTRRWSRTHLNQLMRKHRPRNLPDGIDITDQITVQDVPIELLTHEYCEVKAEKEGETVYIGAGTRVNVPPETSDVVLEPARGSTLDSVEARPVQRRTPFKLMIIDQYGDVKLDMSWDANVAIDEPVNIAPQSETDDHSLVSNGAVDSRAQQDVKYW